MTFEEEEDRFLSDDQNRYDARTDSYDDDPFRIVEIGSMGIGEITETIAKLLFPKLSPDAERDYRLEHEDKKNEPIEPQSLRLWDYARRDAREVEAAWLKVLKEHDEEQAGK